MQFIVSNSLPHTQAWKTPTNGKGIKILDDTLYGNHEFLII